METSDATSFHQLAAGPLVTVIVPLFNRLEFLPQLFSTISKQNYHHIEVIMVDDGSTDGTHQWVEEHAHTLAYPLKLVRQPNSGPYAARNSGLDLANGQLITFQDSDDEWPENHISNFVTALENNPDIDWIFGSIRRINHSTGVTIEESNYYRKDGTRHPLLSLQTERRGKNINVVTDANAVKCAIADRVPGSTQCMLARRRVFETLRFDPSYRTAYDQFFLIRLFLYKFKVAWVEETHQIYHVHDSHISLVAGGDAEKLEASARIHLRGYEGLNDLISSPSERRVLRHKVAEVYAWSLSTSLRAQGRHRGEIVALRRAITLHPSHAAYWKTFFAACARFIRTEIGRK